MNRMDERETELLGNLYPLHSSQSPVLIWRIEFVLTIV